MQLDLSESNWDGFIVLKIILRPSGIPMFLVPLLEPKWCFIYITGTHAGQGDDSAEEQD